MASAMRGEVSVVIRELVSYGEGDGVKCVDIDECSDIANHCSSHANCTNTDGSYTCVILMEMVPNARMLYTSDNDT